MTARSTKDKFFAHVAQTSPGPLGLEIARADKSTIHLTDGSEIIDLISGIAVSSIGHNHPAVKAAIKAQVDKHLHVMVYGEFVQQSQTEFASLLAAQLPESLQSIYFTNSGTESVEGALKLAKKFTGRRQLVSFNQSYHGDTHGSLSVTGRDVYKKPFLPLLPDVLTLPFNDMSSLESISDSAAAVIVEPIQGEGGIRVPSREWIQALRKRCRETGSLLIFDEIQTGMGRTGTLFAFEHFDVIPDILCLAKAFGGGMPLGAFISAPDIMGVLSRDPALSHVTTFGGHPVSCAAGAAALKITLEENLPSRARILEEQIRAQLTNKHIIEIRGMGAMLGMVLADSEITAAVVEDCLRQGVLLGWTLHSDNLVRIAPPLNIELTVLSKALNIIERALDKI